MKKFLAMLIVFAMLGFAVPITTEAAQQTYYIKRYKKNGRWYTTRQYRKPSFYSRHRDKVNMGIGTAGGAIIGGIIGGKKGAGIGALTGLGGSALYTYKIKKNKKKYYKVRRY